ncbi:MAG: molybdopterin molybdotransferase MoeA [Formosimonas sp.]
MSLLSYADALAQVLAQAQPLASHVVPLVEASGKVAAMDVHATFDLPRFNNSAMDGYALRCEATEQASVAAPIELPLTATLAAGDACPDEAHAIYAIMTGAAVPSHCNAVIPIEHTELIDGRVRISQPVAKSANIRFAGEDFAAGQLIVPQGQVIGAGQMAVLASFGHASVAVYQTPRVGLLSTGPEIISDLTAPLAEHQIYNSNTPYLSAQLARAGVPCQSLGHILDEPAAFKAALLDAANDIIISTGAVSMGQWDFIPATLRELGAQIVFHKVAQKPGKPILFARLADGRYFFGLPGNPASCAVGLRFFVQPLLRALQGLPPEPVLTLPLAAAYRKQGALRHFLKAHIDWQNHRVQILSGQESFKISPLLHANAWVVLSEAQTDCAAGELVQVVGADLC